MDVNIHICPTCGGKLSVDIERQMYECPFCGVTFDYDYFREESVLEIASQALKNNEFTSADRAYDFMLEKEPDNFEALRGKALIAMNISKIDDIRSLDLYSDLNYDPVYKEIDRAIGSAKPQDRRYFTVMKDIVDAGREYVDEKAQLKTQRTETERSQKTLNECVRERDNVYIYSSDKIRPKKAVILTILCYLICCLIIFAGFKFATRNPYSKAEDLSKYETEDDNIVDALVNDNQYQKALEREEQRKINYEAWEKSHENSNETLICILCIATGVYALLVFILFLAGRRFNSDISKMQAKADEQNDKLRKLEERIAEIKDRIDQDYKTLCEMQRG